MRVFSVAASFCRVAKSGSGSARSGMPMLPPPLPVEGSTLGSDTVPPVRLICTIGVPGVRMLRPFTCSSRMTRYRRAAVILLKSKMVSARSATPRRSIRPHLICCVGI
jgi:hypothetical protein